jgi:cytochrome c biogenesis protein CcdA
LKRFSILSFRYGRKLDEVFSLKVAGFLLMFAGWVLVLAALAMLRSLESRTVFVLAGMAVELLGIVLAARAHLSVRSVEKNG